MTYSRVHDRGWERDNKKYTRLQLAKRRTGQIYDVKSLYVRGKNKGIYDYTGITNN